MNIKKWNDMSLREKSQIMKVAVGHGIKDLDSIKQAYNAFAEGGNLELNKAYVAPEQLSYNADNMQFYDKYDGTPLGDSVILEDTVITPANGTIDELGNTYQTRGDIYYKNGQPVGEAPLEQVSPEFYILTAGAGIANNAVQNTVKGLPTAVNSAASAASKVATPGSAFWTNPLTKSMAIGTAGYTGTDLASTTLTGKTWGQNVAQATGLPEWAADFTNPGGMLGMKGLQITNEGNPIELLQGLGNSLYKTASRTKAGKWLTAPNRADNILRELDARNTVLKGQKQETRKSLHEIFERRNNIPNYLKNNVLIDEEVPAYKNPVNINKMTPEATVDAYKNMIYKDGRGYYKSKDEVPTNLKIITDNSGNKIVVQKKGSEYIPNIKQGDYSIPIFEDDSVVNGNLKVKAASGNIKYLKKDGTYYIKPGNNTRTVEGLSPLQYALQKNYSYVQRLFPGFKGFDSSVGVMEGSLSHVTHDIDGFMTLEDFQKAIKNNPNINIDMPDATGLAGTYINPKKYGTNIKGPNHIDINVIDINQSTGIGNARAIELYRQFYPREYRQSLLDTALKTNSTRVDEVPIVHLDGTPFTNKELLDAYDPIIKTVMDAIESGKEKHIGRMMEYLAGDRPDIVHKALKKTVDSVTQTKEGALLPKLKFGTQEENLNLLNSIGYAGDFSVAQDPKKMQNVLDLWYLSDSGYFSRAVKTGDYVEDSGSLSKLFRNLTDWNAKPNGMHQSGAFLNGVSGVTKAFIGRPVVGILKNKTIGLKDGMKASDAVELLQQTSGYYNTKVSDKNAKTIIDTLDKYGFDRAASNLKDKLKKNGSFTFSDIYDYLPTEGEQVKSFGKEIAVNTDINAFGNSNYHHTYKGLLDPTTSAQSLDDFGFISGDEQRSFFPQWEARNPLVKNSNYNEFFELRNHRTSRPREIAWKTSRKISDITPAQEEYYRAKYPKLAENYILDDVPFGGSNDSKTFDISLARDNLARKYIESFNPTIGKLHKQEVLLAGHINSNLHRQNTVINLSRKAQDRVGTFKHIAEGADHLSEPLAAVLGGTVYVYNKAHEDQREFLKTKEFQEFEDNYWKTHNEKDYYSSDEDTQEKAFDNYNKALRSATHKWKYKNKNFRKHALGGTLFANGGEISHTGNKTYDHAVNVYQSFIDKGVQPQAALDLTNQQVAEKGWNVYGTGDKKVFNNVSDFTDHVVDWHSRMYPDSLKADNFNEFFQGIQGGQHKYNPNPGVYKQHLLNTRPGVKRRINKYRATQGLPPLTLADNEMPDNMLATGGYLNRSITQSDYVLPNISLY